MYDLCLQVLEKLPGVNVIYFVRDPRATASSRIGAHLLWDVIYLFKCKPTRLRSSHGFHVAMDHSI